MNTVSYLLLLSDRIKDAAEVLKLTISSFPEAFNLFDSYGEVLLEMGHRKEAIKNYEKSVLLNPANQNRIRILEELKSKI